MPVYDYECQDCGVFTALRPMAQCKSPIDCPQCGRDSRRVFLSAPALAGMPAEKRHAYAINEKAAHEPRFSHGKPHGSGCACCSSAKPRDTAANAAKTFPKARPWMISH